MAKDVSPETSAKLADRAQLVLLIGATLLALTTWVYLVFLHGAGFMPARAGVGPLVRTMFEAGAWGEIATLAIPVVLTLVPFIAPRTWRSNMALVAAGGSAITAMMLAQGGIGWFSLPAIAALVAAYFLPVILGGTRPGLSRTNWWLVGALVIALPGILLVGAMAAGTFAWSPVTVGIAVGCVALAAVFASGIRWVALVVGLLGLAAMVAAVLDGGMLLLAFWVLGGFWVVVGLTTLVATGHVKRS